MIKHMAAILLLAATSGAPAQNGNAPANAQKAKADWIFTHGNIYTGAGGTELGATKRAERTTNHPASAANTPSQADGVRTANAGQSIPAMATPMTTCARLTS